MLNSKFAICCNSPALACVSYSLRLARFVFVVLSCKVVWQVSFCRICQEFRFWQETKFIFPRGKLQLRGNAEPEDLPIQEFTTSDSLSLKHTNITNYFRITNTPSECPLHNRPPEPPSCHLKPCHVTPYHVAAVYITSRHIMSHHITSRHFTSRHIMSRHVTSRHVTSRHITSHHFTSLHFTSHHAASSIFPVYSSVFPCMANQITLRLA